VVKTSHVFSQAFAFYLTKANEMKASDIHFCPRLSGGEVRFRVSGHLRSVQCIEDHLEWEDLLKEVKRRSGLAFQKGFAQDSRFSETALSADYRVSLVPVQTGSRESEQIVIRILPRESHFSIEKLGLPDDATSALKLALAANQGLIVVTGPTGSGKTVTLMSALCAIECDKYSVLTLEDPVEYCLPGITQVQVSEKLSFAQGLRAFLRQDPDYILVGETRDPETATAVVQAANTGHVVLTTLHTNSAADAVTRFSQLGVEEFLVRENASFICAQRLIPRLCDGCKEFDEEGRRKLTVLMPEIFEVGEIGNDFPLHALGCVNCSGSGISGRQLVFEYIAPRRNLTGQKELISSPTLKQSAITLVQKGKIHADELIAML
jgi:general secretion pathway protein E